MEQTCVMIVGLLSSLMVLLGLGMVFMPRMKDVGETQHVSRQIMGLSLAVLAPMLLVVMSSICKGDLMNAFYRLSK